MPSEFEIRREVELPATPEQVWDAVTTGRRHQGSWLFPSGGDPEPREGGRDARRLGRHHVGSAAPLRRPLRGRGWVLQCPRVPDPGTRGRHHRAALRAQRHLHRELGQPVRRAPASTPTSISTPSPSTSSTSAPRAATYVGDVPGGHRGARINSREGVVLPACARRSGVDAGAAGEGDRVADRRGRSGHDRGGGRLPAAELRRHPHGGRPVPLLRARRVRDAGRHEHPPLRRRGRSGGRRLRLAEVAGERVPLAAFAQPVGHLLGGVADLVARLVDARPASLKKPRKRSA